MMEIKVRLATTRKELDHAREIRKKVFIMEQNVPEDVEIDQYEDTSKHIIALIAVSYTHLTLPTTPYV